MLSTCAAKLHAMAKYACLSINPARNFLQIQRAKTQEANTMMNVVILAAGQGKRMHSDLPKVLQPLAGKPMIECVLCKRLQM